MLNFCTTTNSFRSTLPVVSNLTAMNLWDGVCMFFIYASMLEFIIVNYLYRKYPHHHHRTGAGGGGASSSAAATTATDRGRWCGNFEVRGLTLKAPIHWWTHATRHKLSDRDWLVWGIIGVVTKIILSKRASVATTSKIPGENDSSKRDSNKVCYRGTWSYSWVKTAILELYL